MMGCSPPASSGEAFEALVPVWIALMVATGLPLAWSFEMLCSRTASVVGYK